MVDLNPFGAFAQGQQIGMARRAEGRLEEDRARAATTRNRLAGLLSGGVPTTPGARQTLVGEIARSDPGMALDWAKHFETKPPDVLARRKAEAPFFVSELQNIKDQPGYERAVSNLGAMGIDVSDMPPAYDPKQINMALQASRYLAEGPPEAAATGPFRGEAQWAQDRNVLLQSDPRDPRYHASYAAMAAPRQIWDAASNQMITITPDMSPYRLPEGVAQPQRARIPEPMGIAGQASGKVKDVTPTAPSPAGMTVTRVGEKPLTPGQKARDVAFGKEYVTWSGGGQSDAEKNLSQLDAQIQRLESGKELTGSILGRMPDIVAETVAPAAVDVREQVQEVVQRNLRLILGAQFTQKEGENLISRAFNPNLDEATNAVRLRRLATQMRQATEAKNAMASHFDQFGTLQGYEGPRMMTMQQMGDAVVAGAGNTEEGGVLPPGVSEEDIEFTMEKHGLSRAEVLERLGL